MFSHCVAMRNNRYSLIILTFTLTLWLVGCTNNTTKLTTSMIVSAFEHQDIELVAETDPNSPSIFAKTYNNVSPDRYQIENIEP
ncbi:hypothetical protein [Paenibacillus endoradicis]|uniref:hypothetical protein n=1 Tax=Paenibacillus endoradicis TaxID=2972487 RepID=UPI0021595858|nr:hypothetical protein [Paenibacillus endoradicis]MCR8656056.1 hypothetical protein [Paenibacillus endoradicis]MCR8658382.1 hypothetical protein [Paenibacillus endoradicis]